MDPLNVRYLVIATFDWLQFRVFFSLNPSAGSLFHHKYDWVKAHLIHGNWKHNFDENLFLHSFSLARESKHKAHVFGSMNFCLNETNSRELITLIGAQIPRISLLAAQFIREPRWSASKLGSMGYIVHRAHAFSQIINSLIVFTFNIILSIHNKY